MDDQPTTAQPSQTNPGRKWLIGGAVAVVVIVVGVIWYLKTVGRESTDDAFVDGHVIPIAAKVAGQVVKLYVDDNQPVKAGDPLADIDPRDYQAALDEQKAKVLSAEADAQRATADAKRYQTIFERDEISKQQLDNANANAATARAALEQQRAALEQAELNLSYTKVTAPEDGRITKRSVETGAYLQVGQNLFSIVPDRMWITANYKETQLTHMRPGQHARIRIDTFPGTTFDGHVDSIQSGTGERFSVMPAENATGNFVKVVQRIPVKILIDTPPDPNRRLVPGMSAEPTADVRN